MTTPNLAVNLSQLRQENACRSRSNQKKIKRLNTMESREYVLGNYCCISLYYNVIMLRNIIFYISKNLLKPIQHDLDRLSLL